SRRPARPHDPDPQGQGRRRRAAVRLDHRRRRGRRHPPGPGGGGGPAPDLRRSADPRGRHLHGAGRTRPGPGGRSQDDRQPAPGLAPPAAQAAQPFPGAGAGARGGRRRRGAPLAERIPPPQNLEAEAMLLGALIDVPANVAETAALVSADDFYREGHRRVWAAIMELFQTGEPIEPITVIEQLMKSGDLEAAGGRVAVLDLMATPYIAATYRTYAEIVHD